MLGSIISIGDCLIMEDDASLFLHDGEIIVDDDLFFLGTTRVPFTQISVVPVPEPTSFAFMGRGIAELGFASGGGR